MRFVVKVSSLLLIILAPFLLGCEGKREQELDLRQSLIQFFEGRETSEPGKGVLSFFERFPDAPLDKPYVVAILEYALRSSDTNEVFLWQLGKLLESDRIALVDSSSGNLINTVLFEDVTAPHAPGDDPRITSHIRMVRIEMDSARKEALRKGELRLAFFRDNTIVNPIFPWVRVQADKE